MMRVPVFLSFFIFLQIHSFGQLDYSPNGELFYDSFEFDLDQWSHVGNECKRTKDFSSSGVYGIQLRDNSLLRSTITSNSLNLEDYNQLTFQFQFASQNFEKGESFHLEFSLDGGEKFKTFDSWTKGVDFENEIQYFEANNIRMEFTSETVFRFRCDASSNDDVIFIDEIRITDNPSDSGIEISSTNSNSVIDIVSIYDPNGEESVELYTNEDDKEFTLNIGSLEGQSGTVEIYDKMGAKLSRSIFTNTHNNQLSFPFDYLENGNYSVCVKSSDDKLFVLRLVIGES